MFFFFFFQAEDGIRDLYVTGVQTCALPIFDRSVDRPGLVVRRHPAQLHSRRRGTRVDTQVEVDLLAGVERDRVRTLLQRLVRRVVRARRLGQARVGGRRRGGVRADVDLATRVGGERVREQL